MEYSAAKKAVRLQGGVPLVGMVLVGCLPGFLKRAYYRSRGARIGKGVSLGLLSYIQSPDIVLGDGASIAPLSFIRARGRCHIGARSSIGMMVAVDTGEFVVGDDTTIGEQVVIGGMLKPNSSLRIGSRVKVLPFGVINPTEPVLIEDDVCIGGGSYIFTHSTWQSMLDGFPGGFGSVTVKRGAWLAWRGFVMPGVTIGEEATVGGASVVTRSVPARSLAVGAPAKVIKTGDEYIKKPDAAGQRAMLMQWLQECAEYFSYIGWPSRFTPEAYGASLQVNDCLIAFRSVPGVVPSSRILLSCEAISASERQTIAAQGGAWFDLAARECALSDDVVCGEFRSFLARYGVRFAVVSAL